MTGNDEKYEIDDGLEANSVSSAGELRSPQPGFNGIRRDSYLSSVKVVGKLRIDRTRTLLARSR